MSYARFSDASDVYIIGVAPPERNALECCGCILASSDEWDSKWVFYTYQAMLDHLVEHMAAGHKVPWYALQRIREEMELPSESRWVPNK